MPHCIIEYSKCLDSQLSPSNLVHVVYEGAFKSGLFEGPDIKTRALGYDDFMTGSERTAFIHVNIRILSGRTDAQKLHLSSTVLKGLAGLNLTGISLTVEVDDIHRNSYAKLLV